MGRGVVTKGTKVLAKTLREEVVDVKSVSDFTDEEVLGRMQARVSKMTAQKPDSMAKL